MSVLIVYDGWRLGWAVVAGLLIGVFILVLRVVLPGPGRLGRIALAMLR